MFQTVSYQTDKLKRDQVYAEMRACSTNKLDKKVVKFSESVERVIPATGEIVLDSKGRVVYDTHYYIAYPASLGKRRKRGA